ncbi:MAG: alpha/beta hydrolase [Oscillospiraceae bacterium]|nr:alpha/beta hydrolase [Oscillospiraceae bacterium]
MLSQLTLLGEEPAALDAMEAELEARAVHGVLPGDCPLAYTCYPAARSRASVVVVHGYTEFMQKYRELAWHCLQMGYSVFLYDQRGHGLSGRETADLRLAHVERFSDYAEDLHRFVEQVVVPQTGAAPIFLFSHSMGGAVAALYLAQHGKRVARSVLASPMLCPNTHGMPRRILRAMARRAAKRDGWAAPFKYSGDFDPNPDFSRAGDLSYVRFLRNLEVRRGDPRYQNSHSTNGWMVEALSVQDLLLRRETLRRLTGPILVFSAGQDTSVRTPVHRRFAKKLPQGQLVEFPDSRHCIFTGTAETRKRFYEEVFRFYEAGASIFGQHCSAGS